MRISSDVWNSVPEGREECNRGKEPTKARTRVGGTEEMEESHQQKEKSEAGKQGKPIGRVYGI